MFVDFSFFTKNTNAQLHIPKKTSLSVATFNEAKMCKHFFTHKA